MKFKEKIPESVLLEEGMFVGIICYNGQRIASVVLIVCEINIRCRRIMLVNFWENFRKPLKCSYQYFALHERLHFVCHCLVQKMCFA